MDDFGYDGDNAIIKIGDFVKIRPSFCAVAISCSWVNFGDCLGKIKTIDDNIVLIKLRQGDFINVPCTDIEKCNPVKIRFKLFKKYHVNNPGSVNIELHKIGAYQARMETINKFKKIKKAIEKKCSRI